MEREQIIKALECCTSESEYCTGCPFLEKGSCKQSSLLKLALSLIKELTEENERLRNRVTATIILTDKDAEKIKAACLEKIELDIKTIKADTVRKMQERLKELYTDEVITDDMTVAIGVIKANIDDIAKETLEDNNND